MLLLSSPLCSRGSLAVAVLPEYHPGKKGGRTYLNPHPQLLFFIIYYKKTSFPSLTVTLAPAPFPLASQLAAGKVRNPYPSSALGKGSLLPLARESKVRSVKAKGRSKHHYRQGFYRASTGLLII